MAMALEARGFGVGKKRTFLIQLRMQKSDWIALMITVALLAGSICIMF
jgi:energy-coupling factor transporter transmembrane protein EcfT